MAIDGRDWARQDGAGGATEPLGSLTIRIAAKAAVYVPLALLVWLAYWSGAVLGGVIGGVFNVVSTAAIVWFIWFIRRGKRR